MTIKDYLKENAIRNAHFNHKYDPIAGDPSDPSRVKTSSIWAEQPTVYLPQTMLRDPEYSKINSKNAYQMLRIAHDFEYWAAVCYKIVHKTTGVYGSFVLNAPQRRVVRVLEEMRLEQRPIRAILLKARQWGGSTLIQAYFNWIQIVLKENWNSVICAHVRSTSAALRGQLSDLLRSYPEDLWPNEKAPKLLAWEGQSSIREIAGTGSKVALTSSWTVDSIRGLNYSLAHLSEVAFWRETPKMQPADLVRSICGGIALTPLSAVVLESTANGIGNFFHRMWNAAENHKSAFTPIFVPWYEIEMYRMPCTDPEQLVNSFSEYEKMLWDTGLTLEMIQWYRVKRSEFSSDAHMQTEYPTTALEAFVNSGTAVFDNDDVDELANDCCDPLEESVIARSKHAKCLLNTPSPDGELKIWSLPDYAGPPLRDRYVMAVDIGGRSKSSDYSVLTVFDRMPHGRPGRPEVVAQWRGHADHDLIGAYALMMANAYCEALLIIESNTWESDRSGASQYILETLNQSYRNLYVRASRDNPGPETFDTRVGFHTNRHTKPLIITHLIKMVREKLYIEHCHEACSELLNYELRPNGSYAARPTCNDDILMTRAMALYVISTLRPLS